MTSVAERTKHVPAGWRGTSAGRARDGGDNTTQGDRSLASPGTPGPVCGSHGPAGHWAAVGVDGACRVPERLANRTTMATATAAQAPTATRSVNRPNGAMKPRLAAVPKDDVATLYMPRGKTMVQSEAS